jgi:hypothetical protein
VTTPLPLGLTPYISPEVLLSAPVGIDFSTLGDPAGDPTPAQNEAEIWDLCARSTSRADEYANQPLRATRNVELCHGPDFRVTCGPAAGGYFNTPFWGRAGGNTRIILSRRPILQVSNVQVCPNNQWPRVWTSLPAGWYEPESPSISVHNSVAPAGDASGGQAIIVGPGYIGWQYGRNGWAIQVSYLNGWPHCSLTSYVAAGATTLPVDDCTGWAVTNYFAVTGATGVIKDSGQQEAIHVTTSSVTAGPGNLTLSAATNYPHQAGTIISTLPAAIEQACIYFAAGDALTRGATTTTIHAVGGGAQSSGGGARELIEEAELLVHPYRIVI